MTEFKDRVCLITGASRGIGRAVALALAERGAQLVLVARTTGGLEELDDDIQKLQGRPATLVPLDITDYDALDRLGAALHERFGKLDALFANAGTLGNLTPLGHMEPKAWERTIAVNLTANWRLIRSLDALLKASDAGRAVFVTSTVGHEPRAYWAAYGVSKAGLEMLARTYAAETVKTNVRINLINPGATRTAMRAMAYPGEPEDSLKKPAAVVPAVLDLLSPACTKHGELITLDREGQILEAAPT